MLASRIRRIGLVLIAGLVLVAGGCSSKSAAQSYPQKPITLVSPFAAGGAADVAARALAEAVKPYLSQPLTVVNKPGGGGSIGAAELIQSAADGYTIAFLTPESLTLSPHISQLPYKGPGDIEPVVGVAQALTYFIVRADSPWKTMREVIDYAKANPGKFRVGHAGIGTSGHIRMEDLKLKTGVDLTLVPFAGSGQSLTALLGSNVEANVTAGAAPVAQVKAGNLRILAVFNEKRAPAFPDVPTFGELNLTTLTRSTYYFIAAPKGTPKEIIRTLQDAFTKALKTDSFQQFADSSILLVDATSPENLKKTLDSEYAFFSDFTKKVKLQ